MRRSARRPSAARGADIAVTCRERVRGPEVTGGPAAQLVPAEAALGDATAPPGRPPSVEVVLGPQLVAAQAVEIRTVVDRALQAAPLELRLRLDDVQRFDAAGVGLLLRVHRQARRHGVGLVCSGPPPQLVSVLRWMDLDRCLTLRP